MSQRLEANMNRTDIHLLDLPVEILLKIFKRLNNMDVLYSLIGVEGLNLLVQDEIFTKLSILCLPVTIQLINQW